MPDNSTYAYIIVQCITMLYFDYEYNLNNNIIFYSSQQVQQKSRYPLITLNS